MTLPQSPIDLAGTASRLGPAEPLPAGLLDRLTSVPVDIEPRFVTALELLK